MKQTAAPEGCERKSIMSFTKLIYHIIFRTKCSVPAISEKYETELYAYILGYIRNKGYFLYRIGGMPDHIHMLVSMPPAISLSEFVRDIKACTSKMLRNNPKFPMFQGWNSGYAAFTYSPNEKDMIVHYIKNQKAHHKSRTFVDEYKEYAQSLGIENINAPTE